MKKPFFFFQSERDVDFKVNCSGVAYLNITMKKSKSEFEQHRKTNGRIMCLTDFCFCINCMYVCLFVESQGDRETIIVQKHSCNYFRAKFDHGEYSFGPEENTTFLVYVYGFKTPFWLQVCTWTHLKYTSLYIYL